MLSSRRTFTFGLAATLGLDYSTVTAMAAGVVGQVESFTPLQSESVSKGRLLVFTGNDPSETAAFEHWLGRPVDGILSYVGEASWVDFVGSAGWAADLWSRIDRPVTWSVPLLTDGADLATAASGLYDSHYSEVAQILARTRPHDSEIFIRTGWEFNGDWMKWAAKDRENEFANAFRRFSRCFRNASERFRIEWNVAIGDHGADPVAAYPGDEWVDVIGMDLYWHIRWDPRDPEAAWRYMVDRKYGLAWHRDFARSHSKPMSYSEWGVGVDNAQSFIGNAAAWFQECAVLYHAYWDSNSSFPGKLSSGQYPTTGSEFVRQFG